MGERAGFVNPGGSGRSSRRRRGHTCAALPSRLRARRRTRRGARSTRATGGNARRGVGVERRGGGRGAPGVARASGRGGPGRAGAPGRTVGRESPVPCPRVVARMKGKPARREHARSNLHRLSIFSTTRRHRGSSSTTRTRRPSGNFGLSPSPAMMVPPGWVAGKCARVPRADLFQPRFFTAPSRAYRDTLAFRAPRFERGASSAPRRATSCASPWTCSVARARVVRGPGRGER